MMIILSYFFFLLIPHATSLTFNLTNFDTLENEKYIVKMDNSSYFFKGIQLTPDEPDEIAPETISGRATYVNPFHLWDNKSGELASFTTYFSFLVNSKMNTSYGDGLKFFLAENNSVKISGSSMGLPINGSNTMAQFVAVEFDTFQDEWDPRNSSNDLIGDHVGIDISSLESVASQKWLSNITGGKVCKAWITYDSVSKNLSVTFTGFRNNREVNQSLYHIIDLSKVLPQWVIFGFSAASSGSLFQINNVQSWAFNSSVLKTDEYKKESHSVEGENKTGLVVGLIVGFCILVTFVCVLVFFVRKKNKKKKSKEYEQAFDGEMEKKIFKK